MRNIWGVDRRIADDMVTVFGLVRRVHLDPLDIDPTFNADFKEIIRYWRPNLRPNR